MEKVSIITKPGFLQAYEVFADVLVLRHLSNTKKHSENVLLKANNHLIVWTRFLRISVNGF